MENERFEKQLRAIPLGTPDAQVRRRLMQQATRTAQRQGWGRTLRWAFAAAAALLMVVNLIFGQIHQERIARITGRPVYTQRTSGVAYAEGLEQREHLMSELLGENGNHKEE